VTTRLLAHFDGKVLVPEEPVELPTDCVLEISIQRSSERPGALLRLAEEAASLASNPDAPTDGAAQHDHYLYGAPKRP
jgi:hypothetical protein